MYSGVNRREFVATAVAGLVPLSSTAGAQSRVSSHERVETALTVNGQPHTLYLDPRVTLLDLLREQLHLTGTKKGCDHGQCGACTLLVDGERVNSCLTLAVMNDGRSITTIEGISPGGRLHPVQLAFIEHDALQCGYCTPGQVCSAVAMLIEAQMGDPSAVTVNLAKTGRIELTDEEIRERMSGNICRCGAYMGIVAAIRAASEGTSG